MRKIILLILIVLTKFINAQQQSGAEMNLGITQPNPTASSMSSYANVPVSIQTGVPNITYDLFNIPTNNKKVNIKLALNYHSGGIAPSQWVGDMGQGWSLLGLGAISREINDDIDERFSQFFSQWYKKNIFDDIYSFSTLDESGRFRFVRDIVNNTFSMQPLSDFESKIDYERTNDNLTLLLQSFTVTNTSGIKYKFNIYDTSVQTNVFMHYTTHMIKAKDGVTDSLISKPMYLDLGYKSTFRLTSILDENNVEIVKYNYYPYNGVVGSNSTSQKLKSIEIKDRGRIEINYNSDVYPVIRKHEGLNIERIVLKDVNNLQVQKYTFNYQGDHSSFVTNEMQPRQLMSYSKIDKNGQVIENTQFDYTLFTHPVRAENMYLYSWAINKVTLSTGGKIEYDFEVEPTGFVEFDTPTPKYVDLSAVSFDSFNPTDKKPFFTLTENKTVNVFIQSNVPGQFWELMLFKKNGNNYDAISSWLNYLNPSIMTLPLESGDYFASLKYNKSTVPSFSENAVFAANYQNGFIKSTAPTGGNLRIKEIKYFTDKNSVIPSLSEKYNYQDFNDNSKSSGHTVYNFMYAGLALSSGSSVYVYKNVKVTNKGYTKYYYKIPEDYPVTPIGNHIMRPNYYNTQFGILDKSEIYNETHIKQKENNYIYNFINFGNFLTGELLGFDERYKLSYIQSEKMISKDYFSQGVVETEKETIKNDLFNINKNNVIQERQIDSNHTIHETFYKYASDKQNNYLLYKNIVGIPLETETKKNGKIISKSETLYPLSQSEADTKTSGLVLPYKVNSTDLLNIVATDITYDQYDSKGNLQQYTTKENIPTTIIWGYNSTQPIAKVTGLSYSVVNGLASEIIIASDADINAGTEQTLIDKLDAFRKSIALQNAQITTYTYDPLIGVTSITPPSGIREIYKYDSANRLESIKDVNGKIIKEFLYNYKH
ncbi:hypothetical protein [Chryseobacterium sp. CFS15]|uniref:hypothetical protein n=1 Tax=Chryseobacterium sp. CFS15 TaxID=2986946 RepID=UPI0028094C4D|nr:hypothetical protein [Chryseobacterium sp. CFS15]MDQ8142929.1 hypothetical protein [Chryseobacterium sp. CFS15]